MSYRIWPTRVLSTSLTRGLLPSDDGEKRIVQPYAIAALFVFEDGELAYDEMVGDED